MHAPHRPPRPCAPRTMSGRQTCVAHTPASDCDAGADGGSIRTPGPRPSRVRRYRPWTRSLPWQSGSSDRGGAGSRSCGGIAGARHAGPGAWRPPGWRGVGPSAGPPSCRGRNGRRRRRASRACGTAQPVARPRAATAPGRGQPAAGGCGPLSEERWCRLSRRTPQAPDPEQRTYVRRTGCGGARRPSGGSGAFGAQTLMQQRGGDRPVVGSTTRAVVPVDRPGPRPQQQPRA
jgi:hypothetical protein